MSKRWTTEEDNLLKEIYAHNRKSDILPKFDKDWTAIKRRAKKLGLYRDRELIDLDRATRTKKRKDSISDEEITLLKEIYENNTKEYILNAFKKYNRSSQSIFRFARQLGLKRNPEIVLREMREGGRNAPCEDKWTNEEETRFKKIYSIESRENIEKAFPDRTWSAIRSEAVKLGLRRNPDKLNEERTTNHKKVMMERYSVEYTTQLDSFKEKSRQTNIEKRGVPFPSQSPKVQEKIRIKVQKKYGTDNVFQSEEIKRKIKETNLDKYGTENPNQNPKIRAKTIETTKKRYGVENPFQMVDRVKKGMIEKYGADSPLKVPEIKKRVEETNIERYGYKTPAKNERVKAKLILSINTAEVREKKHRANTEKDNHHQSKEEDQLFEYLKKIDPLTQRHKLYPVLAHDIDFYLPKYDLWAQFDGIYWHGKTEFLDSISRRTHNIEKTIERDKIQNKAIPNLIRFWSDEVAEKIKSNTIENYLMNKINSKIESLADRAVCHQYKKKIEWHDLDIETLSFDPEGLIASQFTLNNELLSSEITEFIEKYEWLGHIGNTPKWCFTARYQNILAGVVLINEPAKYSKILGSGTPKYEAIIQRGASSSWAPKNLSSRLIMFSCKWMVDNTDKRCFVAYADPVANERGIVYQACGFDYIGDHFGADYLYKHPEINRNSFSSQYLYRTASFRKWCRNNNIEIEKNWIKPNKYKDLKAIPVEIKDSWYSWNKKIIDESEKIKLEKKLKYVLVIGKNRREKKVLNNLKDYTSYPYIKERATKGYDYSPIPKNPSSGKTRSRKHNSKIQYIINNHGKITNKKIAESLNESPRWVKRQIANLIKDGTIQSKKPHKKDFLTEEKWPPNVKKRAIELRKDFLKDSKVIISILKKEFDFDIKTGSLTLWFKKFNCPYPTKTEWLEKHVSYEEMKSLLDKNIRRIDIQDFIQEKYEVYISIDLISSYINSIGL